MPIHKEDMDNEIQVDLEGRNANWDEVEIHIDQVAGEETLGHIKVGENLSIDQDGKLDATGGMEEHDNTWHSEDFTVAQSGGKNIWVQSSEPTAEAEGDIWIETE